LVIYFDIIFPNNLEPERSKYLVKILPQPKKQIWDLQYEKTPENELTHVKMELMNNNQDFGNGNGNGNGNGQNSANNSNGDFEDEDGQQGVPIQCATQ
jgi:hypothetical protein